MDRRLRLWREVPNMQCHWAAATLDIYVKLCFFLFFLSNRMVLGYRHLLVASLFFFWTSSRVLQQGYTPGYGGREKGDEGGQGHGWRMPVQEGLQDRSRLLSLAKCQCETCGGQNGVHFRGAD